MKKYLTQAGGAIAVYCAVKFRAPIAGGPTSVGDSPSQFVNAL